MVCNSMYRILFKIAVRNGGFCHIRSVWIFVLSFLRRHCRLEPRSFISLLRFGHFTGGSSVCGRRPTSSGAHQRPVGGALRLDAGPHVGLQCSDSLHCWFLGAFWRYAVAPVSRQVSTMAVISAWLHFVLSRMALTSRFDSSRSPLDRRTTFLARSQSGRRENVSGFTFRPTGVSSLVPFL
jgi:hypothetical protein